MSRVSRLFDLMDKTAIVTGAASGIGRATAMDFAGAGSKVVVADKSLDGAEGVAREIQADGGAAIAVETDVTSRQSVAQMVERALEKLSTIDILVNNAGILSQTGLLDLKEDDLDRTFDVNLKGVLLCSQEVGRHMVERKTGKIINIGSSLSCRASVCNLSGGSADYCASKAALEALVRSLAVELAGCARVVGVCPGTIDTPMLASSCKGWAKPVAEIYAEVEKKIPVRRLGTPLDMARAIAFLISDEASYINATCLVMDGGTLALPPW